MAIYNVFSHPVLHQYKTHVFSKATVIQVLTILLTFILPLIIVYRSDGLWIREIRYREQPKITFKKELIFLLHLSTNQSYVTYSTFQNYNNLQQQFLRIPLIKAFEEDITGNGLSDGLQLNLEIPLFDSEQVVGVEMLLFFTYKLQKFSSLFMDCMAYIQHSFAVAGAKLQIFGNLQIRQKNLLLNKGTNRKYDVPIVDSSSIFSDAYDLSQILEQYTQRNVTTELVAPYYTWIVGRGAGRPFIISASIKYPEDEFVISVPVKVGLGSICVCLGAVHHHF
ncbi:TMEM231 [Acanthosepion pharaonis]|uniref:Transmembrane protein 231 n=1 Tax=Acanthosepion pharaonis TaxID=158019 RepID=A0A812E196_ACAPH|nr:TMEM231 [Sepia pharaonis]